jgi:hypothetical protein
LKLFLKVKQLAPRSFFSRHDAAFEVDLFDRNRLNFFLGPRFALPRHATEGKNPVRFSSLQICCGTGWVSSLSAGGRYTASKAKLACLAIVASQRFGSHSL